MAQLTEFILNHPLIVGATAMATVALVVNELRIRSQSGLSVPPQEAVQLINQGATVVDLRDGAQFAAGHIVDAVNLQAADLKANPEARLKKKRAILLVCDNGSGSARCVAPLRQAGFEKAWALSGGLAAWRGANLPLVAEKPRG